ncbi:AbrB/MazE/SpoVT family DNA-binding domain-containing protein [Thermodesulfobacteriota bacterium]
MHSTKISSKGQLVIPKEIREKLNIKTGTFFRVRFDKKNIVLTPMKERPIDRLFGKFADEKILEELENEHAEEIAGENRS